jgi:hypothetical protein
MVCGAMEHGSTVYVGQGMCMGEREHEAWGVRAWRHIDMGYGGIPRASSLKLHRLHCLFSHSLSFSQM